MPTSPDAIRRRSVFASFVTLIEQDTPDGLTDVSSQYAVDHFTPSDRVSAAVDSALWGHGVLTPFAYEGHVEDAALKLAGMVALHNAVWMMNSNTLLALALDRYADKSDVMEEKAMLTGIPTMLLGYPIHVNEFASETIYPIVFGVFRPSEIVVRYYVGQIEPVEYEVIYGSHDAPKTVTEKGVTARQVYIDIYLHPNAALVALKTNPAAKGKHEH